METIKWRPPNGDNRMEIIKKVPIKGDHSTKAIRHSNGNKIIFLKSIILKSLIYLADSLWLNAS